MSSLRRPAVLLVSGLLALCPASSAFAQSAGDEQYSDPLAGQDTSPKPKPKPEPSSSGQPSLTQQPQGAGPSGSSPSGSGSSPSGSSGAAPSPPAAPTAAAPSATAPSVSTAGELPRTGLDTGTIAVLGAALLLLGIGLRLRTADARF